MVPLDFFRGLAAGLGVECAGGVVGQSGCFGGRYWLLCKPGMGPDNDLQRTGKARESSSSKNAKVYLWLSIPGYPDQRGQNLLSWKDYGVVIDIINFFNLFFVSQPLPGWRSIRLSRRSGPWQN